jgi:hypothetical protein
MVVSKSALKVSALSKHDKSIPGLDSISIENDGTVVAGARNIFVAVQGVEEKVTKNIPISDSGPSEAVISSEFARKVCDSIENDKVFKGKLEFADVRVVDDKVEFTLHDGRRESIVRGAKSGEEWVPWRSVFHNAGQPYPQVAILNRARLKVLLDVLDKIAPESGDETPVYLQFTDAHNIVLRAKNYNTGQRVLGIMTNYFGKFPEDSEWEKEILRKPKRKPRVK